MDSVPNDCNSSYPYRLSNGACNNLQHKWWGRASTHYQRFASASYADGVGSPRVRSSTGTLPNARSLALNVLPPNPQDSSLSQAFIYFGQFVAHDLLRSAFGNLECVCKSQDPMCVNIPILQSESNPSFIGQKCIPLRRNLDSKTATFCNIGHREQFTIRTHWLDNDNVYGTLDEDQKKIRLGQNGLLKTSDLPNSNFEGLPIDNLSKCQQDISKNSFGCFFSGDDRVESNVFLTSMHTVSFKMLLLIY